ncbi:ABC transporter ATP-binding protein [Kineosporia sp. R_H_3]|uniref:ABC transporter ATP-binding protein n=1 Tax=Kineosporia sp. R_H_3 TaxID=1961848 RepID=UPI000B4B6DC3|nr:ATP-binding cassette domain-containing protein [Kineosporia sp. R_H_3]
MIRLENLTKRYGGFTAVDDVTFEARPGLVTGFLGPNGAGKSTALRMVCGLTPPTSGRVTVLGRAYRDLPTPAAHVGTLLDAAAQHAGRTGREILTLAAIAAGRPRSRVDEMLDLVGLTADESRRRVRHYSLGMRQRLGIAHALLPDPQVLVLDEPANGLDPQGIHWMRTLLAGLAAQGRTVLLSSHLLHEVELVADELVLIGRGRIVAQGSKTALLAGTGSVATTPEPRRLAEALSRAGVTVRAVDGDVVSAEADGGRVARVALDAGLLVTDLRPAQGARLEQLFLELTGSADRSAVAA